MAAPSLLCVHTLCQTVGTGCETELLHVSNSVYCSCVLCLLLMQCLKGVDENHRSEHPQFPME